MIINWAIFSLNFCSICPIVQLSGTMDKYFDNYVSYETKLMLALQRSKGISKLENHTIPRRK